MKRKTQISDEPDELPAFKRPKVSEVETGKSKNEYVQTRNSSVSKGKATKGKRSAGKLERLTKLPMDIIYEIIARLDPVDLLQLTRVSRSFRATFMSKHMWVASRSNFPGLPDCPPDLNEAQYASLIFERKCQACGSSCKPESVDYALRIRACVPCFNQLTGRGSAIVNKLVDFKRSKKVQHNLFTLVPRSIWFGGIIQGDDEIRYAPSFKYFAAELRAVVERYLLLQAQKDKTALESFVKERQEMTKQMFQSGVAMQRWASSRNREKISEDSDLSERRRADIRSKLLALGYKESDFPNRRDGLREREWTKIVFQPRPLTDKSWKLTRPKLVAILDQTKTAREEYARKQNKLRRMPHLRVVWPTFTKTHILGPGGLLAVNFVATRCPSIVHLLERIKNTSTGDNAQTASTSVERDAMMTDLVEYKDRIERELQKAYGIARAFFAKTLPEGSDEALLDDPATLFLCNGCKLNNYPFLSFKAGLGHDCSSGWLAFKKPGFHIDSQPFAKGVLKLLQDQLGDIPDVRALDGRLQCTCGHPVVQNKALTFESLVTHIYFENEWYKESLEQVTNAQSMSEFQLLNDHSLESLSSLVRILPPEEAAPPYLGRLKHNPHNYSSDICVPCQKIGQDSARCTLGRLDVPWRTYHLRAKHGLEDKEEYRINPLDSDPFMRGLY